MEQLAPKNRKSVLIADPFAVGGANFDDVLSEMKSWFRGRFILASSTGTESSSESREWRHGAFTKVLLDALSDSPESPGGGKALSTDDLARRVKQGMKARKVDQHPVGAYTPGRTGFPFLVVPAKKP